MPGPRLPKEFQEFHAAHFRHHNVKQHNVHMAALDPLKGVLSATSEVHRISCPLQPMEEKSPIDFLIIHHKYGRRYFFRVSGGQHSKTLIDSQVQLLYPGIVLKHSLTYLAMRNAI